MRRPDRLGALVLALDTAAVLLGLVLAHLAWVWWKPHLETVLQVQWWHLLGPNPFMPSALVLGVAWLIALRQLGLYDPGRMTSSARIAAGVSRASAVLLVLAMFMEFMLPDRTYSRSLVLFFCGFTSVCLGAGRILFFQAQRAFPQPFPAVPLAVFGVGPEAKRVAERLGGTAHVRVIGFLRPAGETDQAVGDSEILGRAADFARIVNEHDIKALLLATRSMARDEALEIATRADQMGLHMYQVPFTWGIANPRIDTANIGDLPLIDLTSISYPSLAAQTKRVLDLVLTLTGGTLLLPLLIPVALIIKSQDGGPVLFVHARSGKGGRQFPFFKFRSMVVDAEARRAELAHQNETDGVLFKMTNDPRITPFGHFIRKYSIDELPQLLNVIRGDMNLVGPRPLPMRDLIGIENDPEMKYWFEMRSKVKPGITGLWQVSGRSDTGMDEMVRHDIYYIQNWSLWLDIVILLKTFPAVLKGRGAR